MSWQRSGFVLLSVAVCALFSAPASQVNASSEYLEDVLEISEFKDVFFTDLAEAHRLIGERDNAQDVDVVEPAIGTARGAFETAASHMDEILRERFPDSYGGSAVSPLTPTMYVGFVDSIENIEAAMRKEGFVYDHRFVRTEFAAVERQRLADGLMNEGISSIAYMTLDDSVELYLAPDISSDRQEQISSSLRRLLPGVATEDVLNTAMKQVQSGLAPNDSIYVGPLKITTNVRDETNDSISAGVRGYRQDGAGCTFGPNMVGIGGTRYATTAAHCTGASGTFTRHDIAFTQHEERLDDNEDWAVLNVPASFRPALGEVWVRSSWQIDIYGPMRSSMTGTKRNIKGATSGYQEGFDVGYDCGEPIASYDSAGGDSGAPVIYPYATPRIAGIHAGRCQPPNGSDRARYTAIYQVELGGNSSPQYRVLRYDE